MLVDQRWSIWNATFKWGIITSILCYFRCNFIWCLFKIGWFIYAIFHVYVYVIIVHPALGTDFIFVISLQKNYIQIYDIYITKPDFRCYIWNAKKTVHLLLFLLLKIHQLRTFLLIIYAWIMSLYFQNFGNTKNCSKYISRKERNTQT